MGAHEKEAVVMQEVWKPIPGYSGLYEVSILGRVKSLYRVKGLICKPRDNGKGYLYVQLYAQGRGTKKYIHRLVVIAHIGAIPEGTEVNHKDGVKSNNTLGNLELLTHSQNLQHAFDTGLHGGHEPTNKRGVAAFCRCSGELVAVFESIADASQLSKTAPCGISNALAGKQETAGGFIWGYRQ